ncbi:MAG: polysaccharide deacetylase family protein [Betaproteobacteria bacterium]
MISNRKIVVFTGDLSQSVREGIVEIDTSVPGLSWLVVVQSPARTWKILLRNQWRNLRRNGWRWVPYQIGDAVRRFAAKSPVSISGGIPGHEFELKLLEARPNISFLRVTNLHREPTLIAVKAFKADLGLSLAAPILRPSLFSLPRMGTLNLHKGKVPQYRGMPPAFWELWNDEQSLGCTVHRVDEHLDTGNVVLSAEVARHSFSSLRGLQLCLDQAGVDLMREAVVAVFQNTATEYPQQQGGKTYRKPTLQQIAALDHKLSKNQDMADLTPKGIVKELVFGCVTALWHLGLWRFLKPRATVLLYHRVSDDTRDNVTVGIEQFDRQMAMLRKHCQVVSIDQLAAWYSVPRSNQPLVCVTFDDGYLDNYLYAVPILRRHGIAAAFFVSTGIVGTSGPFPHDVKRGKSPPTMNWEQLRRMHHFGFTIGSHTVSHIDCAAEPEDVVVEELTRSIADLRRELNLRDVMLAYPYGGRQNMTSERLELVKRAGYTACLSAYGGVNIGKIDRFNILRGGIHCGFSDRAFRARCVGFA